MKFDKSNEEENRLNTKKVSEMSTLYIIFSHHITSRTYLFSDLNSSLKFRINLNTLNIKFHTYIDYHDV